MFPVDYVADPQFPSPLCPPGMELQGIHFDPKIHLQIENPQYIKNLEFKNIFLIGDLA